MEFEDLQKIWSAQNNAPIYVINGSAMEKLILARKRSASRITNFTELMLIIVNMLSGSFVLAMTLAGKQPNVAMILLSAWMFVTGLYALFGRVRRINTRHQFERSMLGDLDHALATATYQVRLSYIMRWNVVPIALLVVLGMWSSGKPLWISLTLLVFFSLTLFASGWEHNFYKRKKNELETLHRKLTGGEAVSGDTL